MGHSLHADKGVLSLGAVVDTKRGAMWKERSVGSDDWFQLVLLHAGRETDEANALKLHVENGKLAIGNVPESSESSLWKWCPERGGWFSLSVKSDPALKLFQQDCKQSKTLLKPPPEVKSFPGDPPWNALFKKVRVLPLG